LTCRVALIKAGYPVVSGDCVCITTNKGIITIY
jgi:hypothetical protein